MILIVRNDIFVKHNNKLYIVGSTSNKLYSNNVNCMGKIAVLGWIANERKYNINELEEFKENNKIELKLYPMNISIKEKITIIKREVKRSDYLSIKLPIKDALIACHYANKYKKKYVIESAGDSFRSLWFHGGKLMYKVSALPIEILTKYYHKKAKYIIYVSQFWLQEKYPCKSKNIGCPDVVISNVSESILNNRIEKIKNKRKSSFIVGLVGATQAEYRGHDILIRAVSKLVKEGYDIKISFLGGGTANEKRIKLAEIEQISDKVEFYGRLPHKDVEKWIDNIDLLVMPTLAETLGRAIIEAMSRGCPVIGSYETAIREQIGSDCLIKARDYEDIALHIKKMIDNKEYLCHCAIENFYRAKKYDCSYTNDIRRKFYVEFYQENKKK